MASKCFQSGTQAIPVGATDVAITGLALPFTPVSATVNVRQPTTSAGLITAYITSTPTADGFNATLSSPPAVSGYLIDFTLFGDDPYTPTDDTSLAVSYTDLKKSVATFLGYDPDALTTKQGNEVDDYIQAGVRQFYYPPMTEGSDPAFEWDFLRQEGTLVTTSGVADYRLPDGTNRIFGQLQVQGEVTPSIPLISYGDLMAMRSRPVTGIPHCAAFAAESVFGEKGQMRKLLLYPTPEKAMTIKFRCDADSGKLNATTRPFPLGGAMFSELITESCLAIAEQRANDESGIHTAKFAQLLASMIQRDRRTSATNYGPVSRNRIW